MLLTFTFALLPSTLVLLPSTLALLPSTLALLPAASPIPPAPSTATATSTLPGNHHDAALKPRQTDWPAAFWPEDYPPDRWPGQDFGLGWGAVSRPCHVSEYLSILLDKSLTHSRLTNFTPAPAPTCAGMMAAEMLPLLPTGE